MQEYEQIRKLVGETEWKLIHEFLEISNGGLLLSDLLYNKEAQQAYENWKVNKSDSII